MDNKTLVISAHPDDPCTIAGIERECLRCHKVYVSNFSNGDSNVDLTGRLNLRINEGIAFLNNLSDLSGLDQKMELGTNVFTYNASENQFVDDFVYEQDLQRISKLVTGYTDFVVNQLQQQNPDYVLVPHYDGSSQTHDFVHLIVREILKGLNSNAKLFSYPGYPIKEMPHSEKIRLLLRSYICENFAADAKDAEMTDVYDLMCVGRFLGFEKLGLHHNGYKQINFAEGLQDGFYEIPEDEWKPIFLKTLEAFKSQEAFRGRFHHFLDCFDEPRFHEILKVDTDDDSYMYMLDGHHVNTGLATYWHHLLYGKYPDKLDADLSVPRFIFKMRPILEQVRKTFN